MPLFSQMVRRVLLFCCTGIVLVAACSTAKKDSFLSQDKTVKNEMQHNGSVSTLELDRIVDSTAPSGSLQATFTIKNATSSPIPFTFSNSQQYDFLIQDDSGQELWEWSDDRFFAMMIVEKELGQEPWVYRERLPAVNREGHPLPEGQYTLRARLTSIPPIENHLSFQIP
jgi:hypothetical protein